jgi:hypothetical protein
MHLFLLLFILYWIHTSIGRRLELTVLTVHNIPSVVIPLSKNEKDKNSMVNRNNTDKNQDNDDISDINDQKTTEKVGKIEENYESVFIIVEWNKFVVGKSQNIKIPKIKKELTDQKIEQKKIEKVNKNRTKLEVRLDVYGYIY